MLKKASTRIWRLDETPKIDAQSEIAERLFKIVDIDEGTGRSGRNYTLLTIEGRCTICASRYTYSCTMSQINPLQTCERHRGQRPTRKKKRASKAAPKPNAKQKLVAPIHTAGAQRSYGAKNCVVTEVHFDAEVTFEDGSSAVVDYRKPHNRCV